MQKLFSKKNIILSIAALSITVLVFYVYSYAYIEINLSNGSPDTEVSYTISQVGGKESDKIEVTRDTKKIKRLVKRGSYEVSVRQAETSYLGAVDSGGFLQTTSVRAQLSPEKERDFIGSNPNICMYTELGILASSPCGGPLDELGLHMPATNTVPGHVKYAQGPASTLEDVITVNGNTFVLLNIESEIDGEGNYHALYSVSRDGVVNHSSERKLQDLKGSKVYKLVNYTGGFIAYSTDERADLLYYASVSSKPSKINIEQPSDTTLNLVDIHVIDDSIALTYSNNTVTTASRDHVEGIKAHSTVLEESRRKIAPISQIISYSKNKSISSIFSESIISAKICETSKLCVMYEDTTMGVFDVSGDKLNLEYELSGVLDTESSNDNFLIVKADGVFRFNVLDKSGFIDYGFGDKYSYCGMETAVEYYIVCVANSSNERFALKIHPKKINTDSIDKKIASLESLEEVRSVRIYGKFIYISPYAGELQPNPLTGGFGYLPETVKLVNARINKELDSLGISRKDYTINFTIN